MPRHEDRTGTGGAGPGAPASRGALLLPGDPPGPQQAPGNPPGEPCPGPALEVFPVAIGRYDDPDLPDLDVDTPVGRLLELLSGFGAAHVRWQGAADARDADAVETRLRSWARPARPGNSFLYWVGHGWSDGLTASLAHGASPRDVRTFGLTPAQLAEPIRSRQATAGGAWSVVVVDTCRSDRFVRLVNSDLDRSPEDVGNVLLVGVSGDGGTSLGRFVDALERSLNDTFRTATRIRLLALADDLHRQLPGSVCVARDLGRAALTRSAPPVASLSGRLDRIRYLEEVLEGLTPDQRRHFLAKAQGAEHGEISWFFEGRARERSRVLHWLDGHRTGTLVVTGPAGSGKSAFLGHLLVHSLPQLRESLARRGLVEALPAGERPPDDVFDHVVHLAGLTVREAVERIARGAGLRTLPSGHDPSLGVANDLDRLCAHLAGRDAPFTLLLDALDESVDPLNLAHGVLSRLSAQPGVRMIVGTRSSTTETPDHPAGDDDLLRALDSISPGAQRPPPAVVHVGRDVQAIRRYVGRRLTEARDHPSQRSLPLHLSGPTDEQIAEAASTVARLDRHFLFARLTVHELLHTPSLLSPGRAGSLRRLLAGTHRDLFGAALARLRDQDDAFGPLLHALALARGRGLPIADDVWGAVAAALAPDPSTPHPSARPDPDGPARCPGVPSVSRRAVRDLLERAAAYIAVDVERGRTVYRLAHRTFAEHLTGTERGGHRDRTRAAEALLEAARRHRPDGLPDYLRRHLSGHVADAGLWEALAAVPRVLDGLDPGALTADVARTLFGRGRIPAPVAGVVANGPELLEAHPDDRAGLRHLGTLTHCDCGRLTEPASPWGVSGTGLERRSVHLRLPGHTGNVNDVRPFSFPGGRRILVSAGDDATLRLWDPATLDPVCDPLRGHEGTVEALCVLRAPGGSTLIASGGQDGTVRLWDPLIESTIGGPMTGHAGPVWGLCQARMPDGRPLLSSTGIDGTVRLWDPLARRAVGDPLTGHVGAVSHVCPFPRPRGDLLVTTGTAGTVRLWDPMNRRAVGDPLTGHAGAVWKACVVRGPQGTPLVAGVGEDGTVRLWDPEAGAAVGGPILGHTGIVFGACAVPVRGRQLLATAGTDGTVRLWDPTTRAAVAEPLTGHAGTVFNVQAVPGPCRDPLLATAGDDGSVRLWDLARALRGRRRPRASSRGGCGRTVIAYGGCAVEGRDGSVLLATAGADGSVRLWDPVSCVAVGRAMRGHDGAVRGICAVGGTAGGGRLLATAGVDGSVRLWDPVSCVAAGAALTGHDGVVFSVCSLPVPPRGTLLASAGADGSVRLWDPVSCSAVGAALTGHTGSVFGVCPVRRVGGRTLLASAGTDGSVRLWDPVSCSAVGAALTGHTGIVAGLCPLPGPDGNDLVTSTGYDGSIRLWDTTTRSEVGSPLGGHPDAVGATATVAGRGTGGAPLLLAGERGLRLWTSRRARAWPRSGPRPPEGVCALATLPPDGGVPAGAPGSRLVLGTADGGITTVDAATGRVLAPSAPAGIGPVLALRVLSRQTGIVAAGGGSGGIVLWDPGAGRPVAGPWPAHPAPVRDLCPFDLPGGPALASAGQDATIRLWDLTGPGPVARGTLRGHAGWVWSLHALPARGPREDPLLASGGADGTVRLRRLLAPTSAGRVLLGHADQVRAVRFVEGACGRCLLVSGGHDGTVRLWDPDTGLALRTIRLGIGVHCLVRRPHDRASCRRTDAGAVLGVGTREGIVVLELDRCLFDGPTACRR